uniref:Secreted protein n=1 Tax=Anopheles darlingi TaxID=43151 RepID=A0A2M4DGL4_ANODA
MVELSVFSLCWWCAVASSLSHCHLSLLRHSIASHLLVIGCACVCVSLSLSLSVSVLHGSWQLRERRGSSWRETIEIYTLQKRVMVRHETFIGSYVGRDLAFRSGTFQHRTRGAAFTPLNPLSESWTKISISEANFTDKNGSNTSWRVVRSEERSGGTS